MIISHSKKFVFVKSRKTGGSSVQIALSKHLDLKDDLVVGSNAARGQVDQSNTAGLNRNRVPPFINHPHTPAHMLLEYLKDRVDIGEYRFFTIVRNPYDIAVSRYFWNLTKAGKPNNGSVEGFREYLRSQEYQTSKSWDNLFQFVQATTDQITYLRYENLEEDYKAMCTILNIPYEPLGHYKTTSGRKHYSFYYRPEDMPFIDQDQVAVFDYKFEKPRRFNGVVDRKKVIDMDDINDDNVNGATVVDINGQLTMFYAHHQGGFIRKALLSSPYDVTDPKIELIDTHDAGLKSHIASPDIYYREKKKEWVMYYHGDSSTGKQYTYHATSKDGENWECHNNVIGYFYFRRFGDYAVAKKNNESGVIYELVVNKGKETWVEKFASIPQMRHAYPYVQDGILYLFYTRVGDTVEHIRVRVYNMENWEEYDDYEILKPSLKWEGANKKESPSNFGRAYGRVKQLRDPFVLSYKDELYLYYSYAGESGIGVGKLI